jgi:hypothetical protein
VEKGAPEKSISGYVTDYVTDYMDNIMGSGSCQDPKKRVSNAQFDAKWHADLPDARRTAQIS